MEMIRILNWEKFQHYRDREPPWIKLHSRLLQNYEFRCLQDDSKLLLILLWLVRSRVSDVPADPKYLREMTSIKHPIRLQPLIDAGFIECYQNDSNMIATCAPETETYKEETETDPPYSPPGDDDGFDAFWKAYPRKVGKGKAREKWRKLKPSAALREKIMAAVAAQINSEQWAKDGGAYIPNPLTWLNQDRWDDELPPRQLDSAQPLATSPAFDKWFADYLKKTRWTGDDRLRAWTLWDQQQLDFKLTGMLEATRKYVALETQRADAPKRHSVCYLKPSNFLNPETRPFLAFLPKPAVAQKPEKDIPF